jgi:hypothetical protein
MEGIALERGSCAFEYGIWHVGEATLFILRFSNTGQTQLHMETSS